MHTSTYRKLKTDPESYSIERVESLLKHGADINLRTASGLTPLALAIKSLRPKIADFLLKNGANVNAVDKDGNTPLLFLLKDGWNHFYEEKSLLCYKYLIQAGADIHARNKDGHGAMFYACGEPAAEQALLNAGLKYSDITDEIELNDNWNLDTKIYNWLRYNLKEPLLNTVLHNEIIEEECSWRKVWHYIGLFGRSEVARDLRYSVIHKLLLVVEECLPAAASRGNIELVDYVIELCRDEKGLDHAIAKAISTAVHSGREACLIRFIDAGFERHIPACKDQNSVLRALVKGFSPAVVSRCLRYFSDLTIGFDSAIRELKPDTFIKLIEHTGKAPENSVYLALAAQSLNHAFEIGGEFEKELYRLCDAALNAGVPVDYLPKEPGCNPAIIKAAILTSASIIELLKRFNADINFQDNKGRTPLSHAAARGGLECVETLIALGGDITIKDKRGFSPYSYAKSNKRAEIMAITKF